MSDYDLVIGNGRAVMAAEAGRAGIGIDPRNLRQGTLHRGADHTPDEGAAATASPHFG